MFDVVPLIAARAAEALGSGWSVVDGSEAQDRRSVPRADVRLLSASLEGTSGMGVSISPGYVLRLCVERDSAQFSQLDSAVRKVVAKLHNWRVSPDRERLRLHSFAEVEFMEQSLFGFEFRFTLLVQMDGCDED